MQRDESASLLDMLLAARDALEFAAGLTFSQFEQSRLHQHAVVKAVENIGEAASRVSADTRQAHPEIPWTQIIGMRNRLVHAYFDINLDILWQVVQDDLPALITQIEPLVPPGEASCPRQP